jgi:hypothetical protein
MGNDKGVGALFDIPQLEATVFGGDRSFSEVFKGDIYEAGGLAIGGGDESLDSSVLAES